MDAGEIGYYHVPTYMASQQGDLTFQVPLKAFLAIVLWGASFVATKVVLRELSPTTIIVVRFALGLITLVPIVSLKNEWRRIKNRDLGWFLFLGYELAAGQAALRSLSCETLRSTDT